MTREKRVWSYRPTKRAKEPAICIVCGVRFEAVSSDVRRGKGRCCSAGCGGIFAGKNAAALRDINGEKNPNWKGGVEQTSAKNRRYAEKHPHKVEAHRLMWNAIRSGKLLRRPCEECGAEKVEGHHTDYSKPYDVRWLCRSHHLAAHRQMK